MPNILCVNDTTPELLIGLATVAEQQLRAAGLQSEFVCDNGTVVTYCFLAPNRALIFVTVQITNIAIIVGESSNRCTISLADPNCWDQLVQTILETHDRMEL